MERCSGINGKVEEVKVDIYAATFDVQEMDDNAEGLRKKRCRNRFVCTDAFISWVPLVSVVEFYNVRRLKYSRLYSEKLLDDEYTMWRQRTFRVSKCKLYAFTKAIILRMLRC